VAVADPGAQFPETGLVGHGASAQLVPLRRSVPRLGVGIRRRRRLVPAAFSEEIDEGTKVMT
jgi:hypothetical protein